MLAVLREFEERCAGCYAVAARRATVTALMKVVCVGGALQNGDIADGLQPAGDLPAVLIAPCPAAEENTGRSDHSGWGAKDLRESPALGVFVLNRASCAMDDRCGAGEIIPGQPGALTCATSGACERVEPRSRKTWVVASASICIGGERTLVERCREGAVASSSARGGIHHAFSGLVPVTQGRR